MAAWLNFVSHYALARRDLAELGALAAVGAMLPDLWRMADRGARPSREPVASDDEATRAVLAGIAHHARVDARFHASDAFARGEREVRAALASTGAARAGLFAHVAWEIALDGALVRTRGARVAELAADVEAALASGAIDEAARLHHAARERAVPPALAARVRRLLEAIARTPFVAGYADADEVTARLDATRARVGVARFTRGERDAVAAAMRAIASRADEVIDDVLALRVPSA